MEMRESNFAENVRITQWKSYIKLLTKHFACFYVIHVAINLRDS